VTGIRLPLTLSVAGHAIFLALLILLFSKPALVPEPIAQGGIEVAFQPALPKSEAAPLPEPALQPETPPPLAETPPEPQIESVPPLSEAPVVAIEPTPPPPPQPKPAVKRPPKPASRQIETTQPSPAPALPAPTPPAAAAPPQTASAATRVPAPVPSPEATAGYRALLSAWLESHKRYPDGARQRGEEGHAVLRFDVDRSGRVINYAVVKSSGYPDLDESIDEMMRGATLPPFPAGMTEPRMEVSVTIRFSLRR
jgi:periplasmic protein TonB